MLLKKSITD